MRVRCRAGAKDTGLGGEARESGGMRLSDPAGLDPAQGHQERGGAPRQRARDAEHEGGEPLLGGDLEPTAVRGRDGFPTDQRQLAEIESHEREARAAGEKVSRAECCPEPPAALHPEELPEVGTGCNGGGGVE